MQVLPYAMSCKLSYNRVAMAFNIRLDSDRYIIYVVTGYSLLYSLKKALFSNFNKVLKLRNNLTYRYSPCCVCMKTLIDKACIKTYYVTFINVMLFSRNTVHNLIVNGYTNRSRKTIITKKRRDTITSTNQFFSFFIYFIS